MTTTRPDDRLLLLRSDFPNGRTHIVTRTRRTKLVIDVQLACGGWKSIRQGSQRSEHYALFEGTAADITCPRCLATRTRRGKS